MARTDVRLPPVHGKRPAGRSGAWGLVILACGLFGLGFALAAGRPAFRDMTFGSFFVLFGAGTLQARRHPALEATLTVSAMAILAAGWFVQPRSQLEWWLGVMCLTCTVVAVPVGVWRWRKASAAAALRSLDAVFE